MFRQQVSILLIICWSQHSSCFIEELLTIGKKGWQFASHLNDLKSTTENAAEFASFLSNHNENEGIVGKLKEIDQNLTNFHEYTRAKLNHIEALINTLPDDIDIRGKKTQLGQFMATIDGTWTSLLTHVKTQDSKNSYSTLVTQILLDIPKDLGHFRFLLAPIHTVGSEDLNFFQLLVKNENDQRDYLCNSGETSHHTLTRLYQNVILTEIKAHVILCFAYSIQLSRSAANAKFDELSQNFKKQFVRYNQAYTKSLTERKLPYLRACDPEKWRRGEDFHELEGFIQQTMYHRRACYERQFPECHEMAAAKDYNRRGCKMEAINEHTKCDGELYNCEEPFSIATRTHVCVWDQGLHRIRFVENGETKQGTDIVSICPTGNDYYSKSGGFHLADNFCTCQCRSKKWKFVAQIMRSRELENYVIVGMRINRSGEYFCIQIAEGKLEANGHISNFSWVPSTRRLNLDSVSGDILIADPERMHAVFFDDLQLRPGNVLTGVQFDWSQRDEIEGFSIIALGRKFNYRTGELNLLDSDFPNSLDTSAKNELTYTSKNSINMKPYEPSRPDSDGYTHIFLRQSDLSDDYGQSTLPLFDGVPIITNPLSPIGGVGLFHKGNKGYAGFLSLRIYPINYVHYLEDFFQSHDPETLFPWDN